MPRLRVQIGFCGLMLLFVACSTSDNNGEDVGLDAPRGDVVEVVADLSVVDNPAPVDLDAPSDILEFDFYVDIVKEDVVDAVEVAQPDVADVVELVDEDLPPPEPTDVGKACLTDIDCETDAGCLLGFCTAFCKAGGQPIPGACDTPSVESIFGSTFACPDDMNLCMPGAVAGKKLTCSVDADCAAQELDDFVCAGAFSLTELLVSGRCLPKLNRKAAGASCLESGAKCASLICLHPDLDESLNGICTAYCDETTACPQDSVCSMHPVFEDNGELMGYAPMCAPRKGSLAPCADDPGACKFGKEYCGAIFNPGTFEPSFLCVETKHQYGGWTGESCDLANPCFSGWCLFGDWAGKVDSYCTLPCDDDGDCSEGMSCRTAHVAPYEGVLPYGDFSVGVCLNVAEGSPCFSNEPDACQYDWSSCEAIPGVFGLGTCVDGDCPPDCQGKACKADDGCGNPCLENCKADGIMCQENGECLGGLCVDGVCCDSVCDGSCEACNLDGALGICTPYEAGIDPEAECAVCTACDGAGACAPTAVGEDPGDGCGLCQVCSAEGTCEAIVAGLDPILECGGCEVCDGAGGCAPVLYGDDPKDACPTEEAASCQTTGICNGEGKCEMWADGTLCGEAACNGTNRVAPPSCNGEGACVPAAPVSCLPFLCDGDSATCFENCQDVKQCAAGTWCVDGLCEVLPACPVETKLICNTQLPGSTQGLANNWFEYGCVPGVSYNGPDRIYSVKLDQPTRITLTLKDAQFDSALMLVQDACAPDLACANFADLYPSGGEESLSFDAEAGVQYHVAVDGFAAEDQGSYQLASECCQIKCASENACGSDGCGGSCGSCSDGQVCSLGQCQACEDDPGGEPNDSCGAALPIMGGANEGLLLCPEGDTDWFQFDLTAGQTVTLMLEFDADNKNLDMALYGPDCNTFVADSTSPDSQEALEFTAQTSGAYYVLVYSPFGDQTGYNLVVDIVDPECYTDADCPNPLEVCGLFECVEPPPACATTGEPVCDAFIAGDNSGKSTDFSTYASCTDAVFDGPEDRYKLSFPQDTVATITLSGHAFIAGLTVLEKYCAADWACVTAGVGKVKGEPVTVIFKAKAGTLYYLIVEGKTVDDHGTYSFDVDCCTPQCDGKICGDDGCGLSCGSCPGEQDACVDGACVCQPSCDGKQCGDDGCGGDCGTCEGEQDACIENQCICQPSCDGKQCGDDGCGGDCGGCEGEQDACVENQCVCQPSCEGVVCGDDGCGGSCGICEGIQEACVDGACVCQPTCEGKQCGDDGCGGDCGSCLGVQEVCVDFLCVCQPACEGKACGDDGCQGLCGQCSKVESCQDFQCLCSDDGGFESNNNYQTATAIEPGSYPGLAICTGDVDWYKFTVPAGKTIQISVLFPHNDGDIDIFLYPEFEWSKPAKISASSNDNESIIYPTPVQKTFYLKVAGATNPDSNGYDLNLTFK
jgi:hypothetical protein